VTKNKSPYRTHSAEFKDQAVKMVLEQKRRKMEVARDLDISPSMLDRWIARHQEDVQPTGTGAPKASESARIQALEKELADVKMERDILKKAAAYFARDSK
jgi:transposase